MLIIVLSSIGVISGMYLEYLRIYKEEEKDDVAKSKKDEAMDADPIGDEEEPDDQEMARI